MTQSEKQAWEKVREKGRDRFILRDGLLRHGVRFGVLFGLFQCIRFAFFHPAPEPVLSVIAGWAFATVAYGAMMGVCRWQTLERDYQKPTDDDDMV
jgi:hypothetical protein